MTPWYFLEYRVYSILYAEHCSFTVLPCAPEAADSLKCQMQCARSAAFSVYALMFNSDIEMKLCVK